jgi:hypothetical protein
MKYFNQKMDEELILRLQHRPKQGLFLRLASFNSLSTNQIGDKTLFHNLVKMTATCWTQCVHCYPPLANQAWKHWRLLPQNSSLIENIPVTIPKD